MAERRSLNDWLKESKRKAKLSDDPGKTGFNMNTQKLHCLLVLQDSIADALSVNAGNAFLRGFITEERESGEIMAKYRFRYKDGDSWFSIKLAPEKQAWPVNKRVLYLAESMETTFRMGLEMMAKAKAPEDAIICFYPPEPDDTKKTLDWLIAQDLVEVTHVYNERGEEIDKSSRTGQA